jgi:hypothetical protein
MQEDARNKHKKRNKTEQNGDPAAPPLQAGQSYAPRSPAGRCPPLPRKNRAISSLNIALAQTLSYASQAKRHTSHVTRHTPHVKRHTPHNNAGWDVNECSCSAPSSSRSARVAACGLMTCARAEAETGGRNVSLWGEAMIVRRQCQWIRHSLSQELPRAGGRVSKR